MVAGLFMALIGSLFSIIVVSFHFVQYIHSCSPHQFHVRIPYNHFFYKILNILMMILHKTLVKKLLLKEKEFCLTLLNKDSGGQHDVKDH